MTIRILLVEDDPVWGTELEKFLNREPDMTVMDLNLSMTQKNLDGIFAAAEIY